MVMVNKQVSDVLYRHHLITQGFMEVSYISLLLIIKSKREEKSHELNFYNPESYITVKSMNFTVC